jgi:hypothetical protein
MAGPPNGFLFEIDGAVSGLAAVKSLRQLAASEIGYRGVRGA